MISKGIDIIGVPMDYGAGRRGVDMGPSAIRYAGLEVGLEGLGLNVEDKGNVHVPLLETMEHGDDKLRYLAPILKSLQNLHNRVTETISEGRVPLVLGGDHSLALGSISAVAQQKKIGVIFIDCHTDFNTHETSPSGNIHGMPLSALCGLGDARLVTLGGTLTSSRAINPENVVVVGARSVDVQEKNLLKSAGAHVYTMSSIDKDGIFEVMENAILAASNGTEGIYLSFDMDALDPDYAPGVGTPVQGGISVREAHLALEMLAETNLLVGVDMVEVNPILDRRNMTAELAVELILSAFGKTVF